MDMIGHNDVPVNKYAIVLICQTFQTFSNQNAGYCRKRFIFPKCTAGADRVVRPYNTFYVCKKILTIHGTDRHKIPTGFILRTRQPYCFPSYLFHLTAS